MMMNTKIGLSEQELELVNNSDWILTKNKILLKVKGLLEELLHQTQKIIQEKESSISKEILSVSPKISRGENYRGLPYMILDYPRYFSKENIFAIRTLFWWGNFFSITLHLSGKYKTHYADHILKHLPELQKNDFHICISEEQWDHHFEQGNYIPLKELPAEHVAQLLNKPAFLKIAKKIPLQAWSQADDQLVQTFRKMVEILF